MSFKKKKRTTHDESKEAWVGPVKSGKISHTKTQMEYCKHGVNAKFCIPCKEEAEKKFSPDQYEAVRAILDGRGPFFLTGQAGSGKSFVVEYLRHAIINVAVTATTGSAAILVKGRTLHSFAGIHPTWGVYNSEKVDARIRGTDLLIIDEVSMADTKLLDQLYTRFNRAGHEPKLLLVGDFLQLPPVEGDSLFDSHRWSSFAVLKLSQQHRQSDAAFISVLNEIRVGVLSDNVKSFIASRTVPTLPDDCTHLMAHRSSVDQRNMDKLSELDGQRYASKWHVDPAKYNKDGTPKEIEQRDLEKSRFTETLYLKENARVVLLTNQPEGLWVNGSTGIVVSVAQGSVKVKLDSGLTVSVPKDEDEILDGDGSPTCTITQYPIKLAWALTIHKAQGMSMDRVGVDLGYHFAPGQTYVALSRCRTAEGLFLKGSISDLIVDEEALGHCT